MFTLLALTTKGFLSSSQICRGDKLIININLPHLIMPVQEVFVLVKSRLGRFCARIPLYFVKIETDQEGRFFKRLK